MDTDLMLSSTEEVDDLLTGIDPAVRTALYTIRLAEQGAYPATLRKEVIEARNGLRAAVRGGDQAAQDARLVLLGRLGAQGREQMVAGSGPGAEALVLPSRR
ncbi:hypothetical protein [Streptomyces anulatus]